MPFDFFNSGYLAFGNKLTKAFKSLASMLDNVNDNVDTLANQLQYYNQFIGRNYKVPTPSGEDSPVRVNEVYSFLKVAPVVINTLKIDSGIFKVGVNIINPNSNKITYCYGETDKSEGYCYTDLSISNDNPLKDIEFKDEPETVYIDEDIMSQSRVKLFKFVTTPSGKIIISELSDGFQLYVGCYDDHYKSFELVDVTSTLGGEELPEDMELIITTYGAISIYDKESDTTKVLYSVGGADNTIMSSCGAYLKKGDKVQAGYDKIFQVVHNSNRAV